MQDNPFLKLTLVAAFPGVMVAIALLNLVNWHGSKIEQTNSRPERSPSIPVEVTTPPKPKPTLEYEPTVFVPQYQPILPSGVQKNSPAWYCWTNGGGRDCLTRSWNYEPELSEWEKWELEQQQKRKEKFSWWPF